MLLLLASGLTRRDGLESHTFWKDLLSVGAVFPSCFPKPCWEWGLLPIAEHAAGWLWEDHDKSRRKTLESTAHVNSSCPCQTGNSVGVVPGILQGCLEHHRPNGKQGASHNYLLSLQWLI